MTDRPAIAADEVKGGSEMILVVEDDPDVRSMITIVLTDMGYMTLEASNGDEGLRVFEKYKDEIALFILDVVMPGGTEGRFSTRSSEPSLRPRPSL